MTYISETAKDAILACKWESAHSNSLTFVGCHKILLAVCQDRNLSLQEKNIHAIPPYDDMQVFRRKKQ